MNRSRVLPNLNSTIVRVVTRLGAWRLVSRASSARTPGERAVIEAAVDFVRGGSGNAPPAVPALPYPAPTY